MIIHANNSEAQATFAFTGDFFLQCFIVFIGQTLDHLLKCFSTYFIIVEAFWMNTEIRTLHKWGKCCITRMYLPCVLQTGLQLVVLLQLSKCWHYTYMLPSSQLLLESCQLFFLISFLFFIYRTTNYFCMIFSTLQLC